MLGGTHCLAVEHLMMIFIKQFESSRVSMAYLLMALLEMQPKKSCTGSQRLVN